MLDRLFALETFGIKLGLENIRRLCEALGHPERAFASLHIAGTNGKGSVTAIAHAALQAAGLSVGRYTSPHLSHLRERFVVGPTPVADDQVEKAAVEVLDCAERLRSEGTLPAPPTFFEATTAMAFVLFARARVQVSVVEVGLGGRFDATNVLDSRVGAITSIGLDHQQHLGDTIERIAFEKAGIIKPGMRIVCGSLPQEAFRVIAQVTEERGALLVNAGDGVHVDGEMREGRGHITITTPSGRYGPVTLALRGVHQIQNAVVAVRVLEEARATGLSIPDAAIATGLESVQWPGRLELLMLRDGRRVLLDAAHNPDGAHALAEYLRRWHSDRPALVVAIMRDKDVEGILRELLPVTSSVFPTSPETPRAMPADDLAVRVSSIDPAKIVHAHRDVSAAVDAALAQSQTVCVAGSIFVVGAARDALQSRDILR